MSQLRSQLFGLKLVSRLTLKRSCSSKNNADDLKAIIALINTNHKELDAKINSNQQDINKKFDTLDTKMDSMAAKINSTQHELVMIKADISILRGDLVKEVGILNGHILGFKEHLAGHKEHLHGIKERLFLYGGVAGGALTYFIKTYYDSKPDRSIGVADVNLPKDSQKDHSPIGMLIVNLHEEPKEDTIKESTGHIPQLLTK